MEFRRDINGLRGWAVLAVLLYHFGVPGFSGGFAGVDVFFVISGYLMTGIILGAASQPGLAPGFSLAGFYAARARRIMPALLVLCLTLLVLGVAGVLGGSWLAQLDELRGAAVFVSNLQFWLQAGYFAPAARQHWLLHTWTLAVEWQFYLLYPLLLWALAAGLRSRQALLATLAILLALSWVLAVVLTPLAPQAAFYLLPSRAWEMLAGALLYLLPAASGRRAGIQQALGGLVLLACLWGFTGSDPWPGYRATLVVLASALLIHARVEQGWLTGSRPWQWLGERSYSIYLWHWPLVVYLHATGRLASPFWLLAGILASLLLGHLSCVLVEQPARRLLALQGSRRTLLAMLAALLLVLGLSLLAQPLYQRLQGDTQQARDAFVHHYSSPEYYQWLGGHYLEQCNFYDNATQQAKTAIAPDCTRGQGGGIFLWGDSHAQALSSGLRDWLHSQHPELEFYQVATSACLPQQHPASSLAGEFALACQRSTPLAWQAIARLRPAVVVLAQAAGHEHTDYHTLAQALQALGVGQVVLAGPVPQWQQPLPEVLARRHWLAGSRIQDATALAQPVATDRLLQQRYAGSQPLTYVSLLNSLCNAEGCLARIGPQGTPLLFDGSHLTPQASAWLVKQQLAGVLALP